MSKLVIGCGYLGARVARRWQTRGETVYATTRSTQRAEILSQRGLIPCVGDILDDPPDIRIPAVRTVLLAVGYDRSSGATREQVYVQGLEHVLQRLPRRVERLIYVSSTGVYGQTGGDWVDEDSPCEPIRPGGQACWQAEEQLRQHPVWGPRSVILRMAGLYGPGRIPRIKDLIQGRPLAASAETFLNLTHVEDASDAVLRAEAEDQRPAVYCIADGQPCLRREFYHELARLLAVPGPHFAPPEAGTSAWERAGTNKRVSSQRFLRRFGHSWRYPSFRDGLAASVPTSLATLGRSPDHLGPARSR